jgi:hypothetical protein
MAAKKDKKPLTESQAESRSIVTQHIVLQSVDRTPKNIANWTTALETAESVYYPNRSALYDIHSRVELDGHFTGVWKKHIASIRNKPICYYDSAGKKVDEMKPLFNTAHHGK